MTEIYLIRHAQAEGNQYRMMQGHWDGNITPSGEKQIDCLAERFRDIPVDAIYSSDLYRARHTAEAIQKYHSLQIQCNENLREINLARWEGKFFGDLQYEEPELAEAFIKNPYEWYIPDAETHMAAGKRLYQAIAEICESNQNKTIVIASHGAVIRSFMSIVTGISLNDNKNLPTFGNTAVTHLYYDNGNFHIDYVNNMDHLKNIPVKPWSASPNLRSAIFEPAKEKEYYIYCYAEAWKSAHGNLRYFSPEPYFALAGAHHRANEKNILKMMAGDETAGLLEMDSERGENDDYLWIVLIYIEEKMRRAGCGTQTIGRAAARCRELGRNRIRLNVAEENRDAILFYQKLGFYPVQRERGISGINITMEMNIGRKENG